MDLAGLLTGDSVAALGPWLWGGFGLLVGAATAVVVIRRRH
ncbi:hypothetical protein ACFO4E_07150 [Nocardiopsis mangrovi]|uniref:LPXTG cell wall anchor domain-containing protein n=1 Tax=Nocardiopsis mangrovi TaxID=1179818 RepID=A0ABV9DVK3_9ACTN